MSSHLPASEIEFTTITSNERGNYLTLLQALYVIRLTQSALFAFPR